MASPEEAAKAKEMLNGKELDGRPIVVDEAKPMEKKPFRKPFDRQNNY
jgi:RNA recognition motif-containing protein